MGKESFGKAVIYGITVCGEKLALTPTPHLPISISNYHINREMSQDLGTDPRVCSWGFRGKYSNSKKNFGVR